MKIASKSAFSFYVLFTAVFLGTAIGSALDSFAQDESTHHKRHRHHRSTHASYTAPHSSSFIIDADSGRIIESENADAPRYPASLTKMMTLYLTFEALQKGTLRLDHEVR